MGEKKMRTKENLRRAARLCLQPLSRGMRIPAVRGSAPSPKRPQSLAWPPAELCSHCKISSCEVLGSLIMRSNGEESRQLPAAAAVR